MANTRRQTRAPEKPTPEKVTRTLAEATSILLDVRGNAPVGYLDDHEVRTKLEKRLAEATRLVNDAGIAQSTLNPQGDETELWQAWQDAMDLDGNVYADFHAGLLPRPENDPTGIPGKDPELAVDDDYTVAPADD